MMFYVIIDSIKVDLGHGSCELGDIVAYAILSWPQVNCSLYDLIWLDLNV